MSFTVFEEVVHELDSAAQSLSLIAESLLAILRAPDTGKLTPDVCAQTIAMMKETILCCDDFEVKIKAEINLATVIVKIHKHLKGERDGLVSWLQSREHADAVEDACLTGDRDCVLQVELESRASFRRCLVLTSEGLVFNEHLQHCARRVSLHLRRYQELTTKLKALARTLAELSEPASEEESSSEDFMNR